MSIRSQFLILISFFSYNVFSAPEIAVVGKVKADLGKFETREIKSASFTIINKGDEELKIIKVRATCNCGVIDLSKKELAPGEKTTLKIQTTPYDLEGNFSKSVYVETNDPKRKFTQLLLVGNAVTLMDVKPKKMVYAGTLMPGQLWKYVFTLKSINAQPVILDTPFTVSNQPVRSSVKKISNNEYKVMVEIKIDATYTSLKTTIKIPVKQPVGWADIEIFIAGKISTPKKTEKTK